MLCSNAFNLFHYKNRRAGFEQKMSQRTTGGSSSLMALHSDSHKQSILSKFEQLRKKDLLCDVTLVVEDVHFKAHKALLAVSSEYFSLMFTAEDQLGQTVYQLDGMAAPVFAQVMEFIYSARVFVEESATQQLLAMACLMEVSDLVKVLTDLPQGGREGVTPHVTEASEQSKHKRGRPKKNVTLPVTKPQAQTEPGESSERKQFEDLGDDDVETERLHEDDADYNPGVHRQSKRKIRPPLKYKSFKVGSDAAGSKEPGKRGRKRKYPNTEARCEDCGKVFKNHLFLKIHQRTHTGNLHSGLILKAPHPFSDLYFSSQT